MNWAETWLLDGLEQFLIRELNNITNKMAKEDNKTLHNDLQSIDDIIQAVYEYRSW